MAWLFGKRKDAASAAPAEEEKPPETPADQIKSWQRKLKAEARGLDRQIRTIDRAEQKAQDEIKKAAKRSDAASMRILAREVVGARKAKTRIQTSQAQLNSVSMQMGEQLAMVKVSNAFAKSTDLMKAIGKLIQVPEIQATMRSMAMEMERAGMISDMVDDAIESAAPEGIEDAADEEIERVVAEITAGQFGSLAAAPTTRLPTAAAPAAAARARPAAARVAVAAGGPSDAADSKLDELAQSFERLG